MLEKRVLKTEGRRTRHKSFLPQEVVLQDIWTRGLQRRHNSKQQSPWKDMQSTTHPCEQMQYTFQLRSVVQNHRNQDGIGTSIVFDQP